MSQAKGSELAARLYRHVDCLAGLIGPRCFAIPKSIPATLGYLRREWESMGYEVREECYDALGLEATNLIVERPGTRRPQDIVLLGAHYDTVSGTPGADDNASAVAVLLEVSRELANVATRRTIRFVAFACEEPPYFHTGSMGSQHHARRAREAGESILGMLCLEMVGYYVDEPKSQQIPEAIPKFLRWLFPKRGDFLAAVGNLSSCALSWRFRKGFRRASRLPLFSICLPERINEIRLSDNASFWDQGYPALMLTDTSFLRNPHYHRSTDTPETLDYERMAEVVKGVTGALRHLA